MSKPTSNESSGKLSPKKGIDTNNPNPVNGQTVDNLKELKYSVRIREQDGKKFPGTNDNVINRINVIVENNVVVDSLWG
jgi:hypothetical protein